MARTMVGLAPVYKTDRGFEIRREEIRPANNSRYNGYDDDDFGDDDDDFGDDDDDFGDDDDDFSGRSSRRSRRSNRRDTRRQNSDNRRSTRRENSDNRRETRHENQDSRRNDRDGGGCSSKSGNTMTAFKMLAGENTASGAGVASSITIRPQYDFIADDITFAGGDTGATISAIYFGSQQVWTSQVAIPISVFAVSNQKFRSILKGARVRGGLDIIISYIAGAGATLTAVITGEEEG